MTNPKDEKWEEEFIDLLGGRMAGKATLVKYVRTLLAKQREEHKNELKTIFDEFKSLYKRVDVAEKERNEYTHKWTQQHSIMLSEIKSLKAQHKREVEALKKNFKEDLRQSYLYGIHDKEDGNEYWCEQGSRERIEDLIDDGVFSQTQKLSEARDDNR